MRIESLLNEGNINGEDRKRMLHRKEMNSAYKKNASYSQMNKKAIHEILENLLSGKTEKDLLENDLVSLNEEREFIQEELSEEITTSFPVQTEVASTGDEDYEQFSDEKFEFTLPDRFLQSFSRNAGNDSKVNNDLESLIYERIYNKAISTYTYQMQFSRKGFVIEQPQYFLSA